MGIFIIFFFGYDMDCLAFYPFSKPVFQTMQLDIELVGLNCAFHCV